MHLLDVRKLGLVARAVPGLRLLLLGAACRAIALFALVAEERLIANAQLLLELGDPHLQRAGVTAFERVDAGLKLEILLDELLVFGLEQRDCLM